MSVRINILNSLALLSGRDKRLLLVVILIQFLVALLDLAGILLLGAVVTIVTASYTGIQIGDGPMGHLISRLPQDANIIILLGAFAGSALIIKSLLGMYLTRRTFRFLANRQAVISGEITQELLNRPLLQVLRRSSQETSTALTIGVSALTLGTLGPATVIASELSLILVLLAGLFVLDPIVALFSLSFFGSLILLLQFLLGPWANRVGYQMTKAEIGSLESIQHALRAYREITVLGRRPLFIKRFQSLRWEASKGLADQFILNQIGKYVFEIGLIVGGGLLILIVGLTQNFANSVGIITVFFAASARLFPSLLRMQASFINIRGASGAGAVTLDLIADLNSSEAQQERKDLSVAFVTWANEDAQFEHSGFDPYVRLTDVTLRYPEGAQLALDSVTLETESNRSLAIVGATGAGKSTLADVILGVLIPDSGNVSISGLYPNECVARWPGAMAYVPQDVAVLSGSVRDNIALGIPPELVNDSLVWESLERSHLSIYLQESREGLDTIVGENGVQLSGGQRQRLGIARALYSRPKLIVLDEATSALDAETERIITETLDSLAGDFTLIVIAHRLATVRNCDQVIHLSRGRITGRGTFNDVRAQVPDFDRQAKLLGL